MSMKHGKRILIYTLLILALLCACTQDSILTAHYTPQHYTLSVNDGKVVADVDWVINIEKDPEKDFVILNLTDIQMGTGEYMLGFGHIREMVTSLVQKTQPDLITYTGDLSYGCGTAIYGICSFIDSFGIPWTPVYGNHDFENSGMSPDTLAEVFRNYGNCLFRNGPSLLAVDEDSNTEAVGNYVVNITQKQNDGFNVVKSLVFFNSGTTGITDLQMQWYQDCMDSVAPYGNGDSVTSAAFMHIPIDGYRDAAIAAYRNRYASLVDSYREETWNEGYETSFGTWHEGIGSRRSAPEAAQILKSKGNDLVVSGHNHTNCFCIDYDGMTYLFALKTGPACYYEKGMEGGSEITIDGSGKAEVRQCFFYEGHGCYYTPQEF
jgi:hypothetical protein